MKQSKKAPLTGQSPLKRNNLVYKKKSTVSKRTEESSSVVQLPSVNMSQSLINNFNNYALTSIENAYGTINTTNSRHASSKNQS